MRKGLLLAVWSVCACAAGSDGSDATSATSASSGAGAGGGAGMGGGGGSLASNGTVCAEASECESDHCVDGVCCETACTEICQSCSLVNSKGTCAPVAAGADPDMECGTVGCDGMGECAYGAHVWSKIYGGLGEDMILDAAIDASGNVILCGYVQGPIDFGGGTMTAHGGRDIFVAKLDANGAHLWSKVIGETTGSTNQTAYGCTTDSQERVIVVGALAGDVDFGGGVVSGAGDAFVVVYDALGAHVWSKAFPHGGAPLTSRAAYDVAVDSVDDIVLFGEFTGNMNVDGNIIEDGNGSQKSLFLVKLTTAGNHVWSMSIGNAVDAQQVGQIAITSTDDVVLTAAMGGTVTLGTTNHTSAGGFDALVAKLDANGNHLWSKRFGDAMSQEPHGLALDASGNVYVTGGFAGAVNFGGGNLTSAGNKDVFVASFDPDGVHLWGKAFGSAADQYGWRVAVDSQDVIVTGSLVGSIDFGGGAMSSEGDEDLFLVKLATDSSHLWSKRYGDFALQRPAALVAAPQDHLLVAAVVEGSIDFGGGMLESAGQEDVAAALLGP